MDLGVGSFVFSQGLVSAIPLLKNPFYLTSPLVPKIIATFKKTLPLFCLGLVRVLLVKGTEYPVSISYEEIFVRLTFMLGTRNGIWRTLEFFHHISASSIRLCAFASRYLECSHPAYRVAHQCLYVINICPTPGY